jgi:hypothetical protein
MISLIVISLVQKSKFPAHFQQRARSEVACFLVGPERFEPTIQTKAYIFDPVPHLLL